MNIYHHWSDLPQVAQGRVIVIGMFDGVHNGHRSLLQTALSEAGNKHAAAMVFTFNPHPLTILQSKEYAPLLIQPLAQRLQVLRCLGFDDVLVQTSEQDFFNLTAEQFIKQVLVNKLQVKAVVVGEGFRFGKGGKGDVSLLKQLGSEHHFMVQAVPHVADNRGRICSSRIRICLTEGAVTQANILLGHDFSLYGKVIHGDGRGKTIGFPTANIAVDNELIPSKGVYAGRLYQQQKGGEESLIGNAVMNIGFNPTFGSSDILKIEAHIYNDNAHQDTNQNFDLYGQSVRISLLHRLRGEMTFSGVEMLCAQIEQDITTARELLK